MHSRRVTLGPNLIGCSSMELLCEKMHLGPNLIVSNMAIIIMCNVILLFLHHVSTYIDSPVFHELFVMKTSQRKIETSGLPELRLHTDRHWLTSTTLFPYILPKKNERAMFQVKRRGALSSFLSVDTREPVLPAHVSDKSVLMGPSLFTSFVLG